jgi:TPR repeat protein
MVVLGQRPGQRDKKPSTVDWLRHLIAINEARPTSTPTIDGQPMPWPLFPIRTAPWPLLMPLARPIPLSEARYAWEAFQGQHGPDRYHTYGPYRGDEDVMANSLSPSRWFWDAWPDRCVRGGMCVPLSKSTVDLYSALGKPAVWAGQPGHSNLISFQFRQNAWTAEVEQAFAGGPAVTFAQWYFDEQPGTQLRFRDLYDWAGAEYHLGLAVGMNVGLASYTDTRLAAHLFRILPAAERSTLGVALLRDALRTNPYNPEIWYRLGEATADPMQGLTVAEMAQTFANSSATRGADRAAREQYWRTVGRFVADYAILSHAPPKRVADRQRVLAFLRTVPDASADDLAAYAEKFVDSDPEPAAVAYDKRLADRGDAYGLLRVGQRYRDGDGVAPSEANARQYLSRAAASGDLAAASLLGSLSPVVPADWITVTPSSEYKSDQTARHLVDGSGMAGGVHDNEEFARTMWHTPEGPAPSVPAAGLPASPAWVRFDLKQPMKVESVLIWNENQVGRDNRGLRKTRIYASSDGANWFPFAAHEVIDLPRAGGKPNLTPVAISNAAPDRPLKSLIIAANATDGNYGGNCYGLSAVRFALPRVTGALPARSITVTASSTYLPRVTARHLIDGTGMLGALHDNEGTAATMWHTVENPAASAPAPGLPASPAWVRFDFARPRTVAKLLVWNHNQAGYLDRGFRKTRIYGSADGVAWRTLTSEEVIELPRAGGGPLGEPVTIEIKAGVGPLKAMLIAADATDGNYGGSCYGLSAARFILRAD